MSKTRKPEPTRTTSAERRADVADFIKAASDAEYQLAGEMPEMLLAVQEHWNTIEPRAIGQVLQVLVTEANNPAYAELEVAIHRAWRRLAKTTSSELTRSVTVQAPAKRAAASTNGTRTATK
jgi:hypothetical protein